MIVAFIINNYLFKMCASLQDPFVLKAVFGSRKIFSGKYLFSGNAIFRKGKYFQVFGCIWENIFWCLVVLLKIP